MRIRLAPQLGSWPRRLCSVRAGVTAVEFAFVFPVFVIFVLGLIEIGRGFMVTHELTSAARNGCRVGVLQGKSNTDIQAVVDAALKALGVSGYTTTVKVNDVVANASTAVSNDQIQVTITVPVANITWLPGAQYLRGNLYGQFNLRRE